MFTKGDVNIKPGSASPRLMRSTDTQVVHGRATCTENEQNLDLP